MYKMSNNLIEAISLLDDYRLEQDEEKAMKMHKVLVRSLIQSSVPVNKENLAEEETHTVTFSLDNNLLELFEELASVNRVSGWKRAFLNKAALSQAIKELYGSQFGQQNEMMIEEPSFNEVLNLLYDYKNEDDSVKLTEQHMTLIRLLLEHRVMNTEGTTVGAISTPVGFAMDKDLFELFDSMSKGRERGWKRNFLNRAVFNAILKVIEEKKFS